MSLDAIRWAWQQQIKPASLKLLLLSLADRANGDDFTCYPSMDRLTFDTGLNRKTIIDGIRKLCDLVLIEKTGKYYGKTGQIAQYRLCGVPSRNDYEVFHYVYKTTDLRTDEFYIGVRSARIEPTKDRYFGSGRWISYHDDKQQLTKIILSQFPTRKEAELFEAQQIATHKQNPLCRNLASESFRFNSTENGTLEGLKDTENGTLERTFAVQTVPFSDSKSTNNGTVKQSRKRDTEPTNIEPIRNNQKKDKTKKNTSQKIDLQNLPSGISETIAQAFIEHRKLIKKPLTQFAFELAMKEALRASEAGMTPEQLIEYSIRNGWQGINVDWAKSRTGKNGNGNKPLSAPERVAAAYAKKNAEKENANRARNTIDLAKDDDGIWSPLDLQLRRNR